MIAWLARAMAVIAIGLITVSVWRLEAVSAGLDVRDATVDGIPVTVHRTSGAPGGPLVVIAHGFAGSRQIMQSFAITLARNGYTAVTFDFQGHGRNPEPLGGDVTDESGATQRLLGDLATVAAFARTLSPEAGEIAVVGHSMASDIVVRYAGEDPGVVATVAVSMFSPAVTAAVPRNLLVVVGDLESDRLKQEGLKALTLAHPQAPSAPGATHGSVADGTARRVAFAAGVEHVGVLFARDTLRETVAWLDAVFGRSGTGKAEVSVRGPWIALLILGIGLLAWPMARLLPTVSEPPTGAGLGWRPLAMVTVVPAVLTPLLLWQAPTDFLAMLVGDYLVAHFALFGAVQLLCLWRATATPVVLPPTVGLAVALGLSLLYGVGAVAVVIDSYFTSFVPTGDRMLLALLMMAAGLVYFAADEWAVRGSGRGWLRVAFSRAVFLMSLMAAVALNREDLFFLIILIPMILVFFVLYGAFSAATYGRTGHPLVGAVVSAAALAWAVASVFPILAEG